MNETLIGILASIALVVIFVGIYWFFSIIVRAKVSHSVEIELARGRAAIDVLLAVFVYVLLFSDRIDGSRVIILGANLNYLLLLLGCLAFYIDYRIRKRTSSIGLLPPPISNEACERN